MTSTALFTDHYELTMAQAALKSGHADRPAVFEVFARRLGPGRRFGIFGGAGRLLELLGDFRFGAAEIEHLAAARVVDDATLSWLSDFRFTGDIDGYAEGDAYFPHSPVLQVRCRFAEGLLLETLALSVLNHDSAVASAAARMVVAAAGKPLIEAGSRRTHEQAAVASARMAYICGFDVTSNLEAARRYGVPSGGTTAHAWVLAHDHEAGAFADQVATFGPSTTLLVDTFDIENGIELAVSAAAEAGGVPAAIRIDSGDLFEEAEKARRQLDRLGATDTRIVVSGDLDEFRIRELADAPIDRLMVGTQLVVGSGVPTAGFVYKLVERADDDGVMRPAAKRSALKPSFAGRKAPWRRHGPDGVMVEERYSLGTPPHGVEPLFHALVRGGQMVDRSSLADRREVCVQALRKLPVEALRTEAGTPAFECTLAD